MLRSLLRLFASDRPARPLFESVIAAARQSHWYRDGGVADTVEGRFAVLASLTALANLRLETGGDAAQRLAVGLAECFIDEMDGEVRQMGVGDPALGKQVGALVGGLGRRLGRFRAVTQGEGSWDEAVAASLYRGPPVTSQALDHAVGSVQAFWAGLQRADDKTVIAGDWP